MSRTLVGCSAALILAGLLPLALSQPEARRSGFLNGHHAADDFPAAWVVAPSQSREVCNHAVSQAIPNPGAVNLTETTCPKFGKITETPTFHVYGTHPFTGELRMYLTNNCDPLLRHQIVHNSGSGGKDMNFVTRDDQLSFTNALALGFGLGKICDANCEALALNASGGENEKVIAFKPEYPFNITRDNYQVVESVVTGQFHRGLVGRDCCDTWNLMIHDDRKPEIDLDDGTTVYQSDGSFLHWSLHLPGCSVCDVRNDSSCPPLMMLLDDGVSVPNDCYTAKCVPPNCQYSPATFKQGDPLFEFCGTITCEDCGENLEDEGNDCRSTACTILAQQNLTSTKPDDDDCTYFTCVQNESGPKRGKWECQNVEISRRPDAPVNCQPPFE